MNVFKRLSFSFLCALLLFGCAADWRIFAKETRTPLCPSPVSLEDFSVYEQPDAAAKAYLVMEATTGRVLCGQNIHQRLPMASTTKIIGAMMVLEQPNLHDYFLVDPDAIQVEGSSMGLMEGDMVSLYALACGMLLPAWQPCVPLRQGESARLQSRLIAQPFLYPPTASNQVCGLLEYTLDNQLLCSVPLVAGE